MFFTRASIFLPILYDFRTALSPLLNVLLKLTELLKMTYLWTSLYLAIYSWAFVFLQPADHALNLFQQKLIFSTVLLMLFFSFQLFEYLLVF